MMTKLEKRQKLYNIICKNPNLTITEIQRVFIQDEKEWITFQSVNANVKQLITEGFVGRERVVSHKKTIPLEYLENIDCDCSDYEKTAYLINKAVEENKNEVEVNVYKAIFYPLI